MVLRRWQLDRGSGRRLISISLERYCGGHVRRSRIGTATCIFQMLADSTPQLSLELTRGRVR